MDGINELAARALRRQDAVARRQRSTANASAVSDATGASVAPSMGDAVTFLLYTGDRSTYNLNLMARRRRLATVAEI